MSAPIYPVRAHDDGEPPEPWELVDKYGADLILKAAALIPPDDPHSWFTRWMATQEAKASD